MGEFAHASPRDAGVIVASASREPDAGGLKPASRSARHGLARVWAALGTYPRRWHVRICAVLLLAFLFGLVTIPQDVRGRTWMLLVQLTAIAAMFAGMVTEHVKEQLLDARAALTPAFRSPHLAVWLVLLLAGIVVLPAGMARLMSTDAGVHNVQPTSLSPRASPPSCRCGRRRSRGAGISRRCGRWFRWPGSSA